MVFKRFELQLYARLALFIAISLAFSFFLSAGEYYATSVVLALILVALAGEILRFISRTNTELQRFFSAIRYADFSQRFDSVGLGSGFAELGDVFGDILKGFENVRLNQEQEIHQLKSLIEHIPVPLMSLHKDQTISLRNNGARRLFGAHHVTRLQCLEKFGPDFAREVSAIRAGETRLAKFIVDDMVQHLSLSATKVVSAGVEDILVSMQNIQSELDVAQLQAWQDLVSVLTHEIMNSVTPVASLSKTVVDLVEDAKSHAVEHPVLLESLDDIGEAIGTVSRRSESLMHFVGNYRQLTRLPAPDKSRINAKDLFQQVSALLTPEWTRLGFTLSTSVEPDALDLNVDIGMLEQVLINLLKNALQATEDISSPRVVLSAFINSRGHAVITVEDNGRGVPQEIIDNIFVPFFTTKRDGSGVGLALTRQVMVLHGGNAKYEKSDLGGARFSLVFMSS